MSDCSLSGNVVTVFVYRRGKSRAECSCGWEGRPRLLRGIAVLDALVHAGDSGLERRLCLPDQPLIISAGVPA